MSEFEYDHHSPLLPLTHRDDYDWDTLATRQHGRPESSPSLKKHKLASAPSTSKLRRHHKLAGLLKVATCFFVACWILVAVTVAGWSAWFFWTRHNAFAKSVFAFPLEPNPLPVEHLASPFPGSTSSLASVQQELDARFESLSVPPSTLPCDDFASSALDGNSTLLARYSALPSHGPYLFALNLYNSQDVLSTLTKTLLTLADFLGRDNVLISIFENGSRDNTTIALAHFAAALTSMRIEHTIVSDPRSTDWKRVDRIDQLAVYRNVALSPVTRGLNDGRAFEDVLFMNDVYVGPMDALELLWQRREQQSDAACAMDWRETKGILSKVGRNSIKMYDNWVSLTLLVSRSECGKPDPV